MSVLPRVWKRALGLLKAAGMKVLAVFSLLRSPMRNAAIYIDGSNLVNNLQQRGWPAFIDLDYLAEKLVSNDKLVHILYSFSSPHPTKVPEDIKIEQQRYHDILRTIPSISLGEGWRSPPDYLEKAVDVILAINFVMMARNNNYDVAYLITSDSDLAPAVDMVREIGKEVVYVYFYDKYLPKEKRRFSGRLNQAANRNKAFEKNWARPI